MKILLLIVTVLICVYATYGINGGKKTSINNFKYVVNIRIRHKKASKCNSLSTTCTKCTGGIIHEKFILTAAHCFAIKGKENAKIKNSYYRTFKKEAYATVYANTDKSFERSGRNTIKRSGKKVHFIEEYFKTSLDDIAILELAKGLHLDGKNRHVLRKLRFPSLAQQRDRKVGRYKSYNNAKCLIAGFGEDKRLKYDDYSLKEMYAKIVSRPNYSNEKKYLFGHAITKDGRKPNKPLGICNGDSGAPVVLLVSPLTIIGVAVTTNEKCNAAFKNEVEKYIRVTNYLDFIKHVTLSKPKSQKYKSYNLKRKLSFW